jgi:uncharacterized phage protein gp47/JayE
MAFTKRSYDEIRDSILAQLVGGVIKDKQVYEGGRTMYKLDNTPVTVIVLIEGIVNGSGYTFETDLDYTQTDDMLEWLADGTKPDNLTPFYVTYISGLPTGITDINPGSVVRTISEAVSREIEFLYAQLNHVYRAGFIDTASGSALDLLVSILGIERKPAEHATGKVTFGRITDPGEISVDHETHVYDGKTVYELKTSPVKSIVGIEGTLDGELYTFEDEVDYAPAGSEVEWLAGGKKPDLNSVFYVDYRTYEQIKIPEDITVSTYARRPEDVKVFSATAEAVLEKTPEGRWETDVPVRSTVAGTAGNVVAGTIIVMPQPPMGVEYVINREDILNGVEAEKDDELRERGKHALEMAGKATLISLESAIRGVEGVNSILIEEMADGVPGLVKLIVDGGNPREIERVINDTKAAGVRVEFSQPKPVHIDVTVTITPKQAASSSTIASDIEAKVRSYISSLNIGKDVIFRHIVGVAFEVDDVYDVTELKLKAYRKEGEEVVTSTNENIEIRAEERAVPRDINVLIKSSGGA